MGLFGEEDEETAGEVDPSVLEDEANSEASGPSDEEAESEAPEEPEPEEQASPDQAAPDADDASEGTDDGADGGEPGGSQGSGEDIDVEEALKDLSARMSVLSSNLEGVQENRDELEDKIGDVEERMSRLGSLAEAVSSEYNPFVSENAPDQPSWTPEQEGPEAGEDPASEALPDDDPLGEEPSPEAEPSDAGEAPEPPEPEAAPEPEPAEPEGPMPQTDPRSLEPDETPQTEPRGTDPLPDDKPDRGRHVPERDEPDDFEENLILLEWVGMMLDKVGRAGLMDLLDYYQNLGWLDRETKDQATRVAVGVDAPDRVDGSNWRGDVDLHRKSLVAIQRLQGDEIPAARLDELELDLRRLFRE